MKDSFEQSKLDEGLKLFAADDVVEKLVEAGMSQEEADEKRSLFLMEVEGVTDMEVVQRAQHFIRSQKESFELDKEKGE